MKEMFYLTTHSMGAVAKSLARGLVSTGFASWYWLSPKLTIRMVLNHMSDAI